MAESSRDAGVIAVLLKRFETQRLPKALALKERVDKGERLNDWDTAHLEEVLKDVKQIKPLIDEHPELQTLYTRGVRLYEEITAKALENEKASQGSDKGA